MQASIAGASAAVCRQANSLLSLWSATPCLARQIMSVAGSLPDCAVHRPAAAEREVEDGLLVGAGVELGALDVVLVTAAGGALTPVADVVGGAPDGDDPPHAARPMQVATVRDRRGAATCSMCVVLHGWFPWFGLERGWGSWKRGVVRRRRCLSHG